MSNRNYGTLMRSLNIPLFHNIEELANLTGLSESLLYCLSKKSERYYRSFSVSKKNGGKREIFAPSYTMQIVQRWILLNILNKIQPSKQSMAFRRGKEYGCKANALFHIETHYGVSMDLKNFFPSISANRVYTVFSNIGYDSMAATLLTNLCILDGHLPQGGPCSPALSNLVCVQLDARLNGLCEKRRIRFSRYADDMYFSCDNQDVLKKAIPIIREIIADEGFTINDKKVHYHTPSNRKMITGVIVSRSNNNDEPQIYAKKDIKRKIRVEIAKMIFTGNYSEKDHVLGEISYVNYLEPNFLEKAKKYIYVTANKIKYFPELVNAFNENLFFKNSEKLVSADLSTIESEFDDDDEYFMYMENLYDERQIYLKKYFADDICNYEKWPPVTESCCNIENDCPF